jgi:hypothetical protein
LFNQKAQNPISHALNRLANNQRVDEEEEEEIIKRQPEEEKVFLPGK